MNELQVFTNEKFGKVRTVTIENEPWFIAKDVCECLEIANTTDTIRRLDGDEKARLNLGLPGGDTNVVNEYGLYNLVLGSRKPEAKAFKRWITHEVIPSIRKTGEYKTKPLSVEEISLLQSQALVEHKRELARLKMHQEEQDKKMEVLNSRMDTFNGVGTDGDKQQKLGQMIRLYAVKKGLQFQEAWKHFRQAYNIAFHTNITLLKNNYMTKKEIKSLTVPAYLVAAGYIDDALMVADKLLNNVQKAGA